MFVVGICPTRNSNRKLFLIALALYFSRLLRSAFSFLLFTSYDGIVEKGPLVGWYTTYKTDGFTSMNLLRLCNLEWKNDY